MTAPTNGARLKQQGWGSGRQERSRSRINFKNKMDEKGNLQKRSEKGNENMSTVVQRAVCRPMLSDVRKSVRISIAKKGSKGRVPRLPIAKPEALEGKGVREPLVAVAADRLDSNTHFVKAADLRAREDGEKKKRKGKIKKERKKDLGQQNSEKTAKE